VDYGGVKKGFFSLLLLPQRTLPRFSVRGRVLCYNLFMPDDQKTPQNPTPEENSIPASPQEPTADAPIPPIDSEPVEVPSEAPEAPREGFSDESNNIPPSNSTPTEAVNESKTEEKQAENEPTLEPVFEPVQAIEPSTAQIPVFEPLAETTPREVSPLFSKPKLSQKDLWKRFLDKVSIGKRKKLDRILSLFLKQSKITNDEVEKFLHVSDATATRYLSILEKEGKIKQNGKTGHMVSYSRI